MAARLVPALGVVESRLGFPYTGNLVEWAPLARAEQRRGASFSRRRTATQESRAGQFDNSVGYIGLSNATFGTLTVGRVTSLTLDGVIGYDPMGGSYAFSALGYCRLLCGLRRHGNEPR